MVNILLTHYKLYLGCSAWGTSRVPRRGTVERLHPGTRTQWRSIDPPPSPDCTLPYWRSCFSRKFCFYMGDSVLSNLFAICPFIFVFLTLKILLWEVALVSPQWAKVKSWGLNRVGFPVRFMLTVSSTQGKWTKNKHSIETRQKRVNQ